MTFVDSYNGIGLMCQMLGSAERDDEITLEYWFLGWLVHNRELTRARLWRLSNEHLRRR